ncbi:MAG: hypothetical protein RR885_05765, partial [Oscillospiraceae bacterium]
MKNTDIEKKLARAYTHAVPDVLNDILSNCEEQKGKVIEMKTKTNNKTGWIKTMCATAAALALVVGGGLGFGHYQVAHAVDSVVSLDVNPSVKIEANKDEIVLSVSALNEDGSSVLEGKDFEGKDIEAAVGEIVKAMVEKGYLSEDANSILVSVDNSDAEKGDELKKQLVDGVGKALSEKGIDGAILSQNASKDKDISKELTALAEKYNISEGKAELIKGLVEKDPKLNFKDMAGLNINDLGLLTEKYADKLPGLSMTGKPSDSKYAGVGTAVANVLEQVKKATADADPKVKTNFEYSDGKLVCEIQVETGKVDYACIIDAVTGEIIKGIGALEGKAPEAEAPKQDPTTDTQPTPSAKPTTPTAPSAKPTKPTIPGLPEGVEIPGLPDGVTIPGL